MDAGEVDRLQQHGAAARGPSGKKFFEFFAKKWIDFCFAKA